MIMSHRSDAVAVVRCDMDAISLRSINTPYMPNIQGTYTNIREKAKKVYFQEKYGFLGQSQNKFGTIHSLAG